MKIQIFSKSSRPTQHYNRIIMQQFYMCPSHGGLYNIFSHNYTVVPNCQFLHCGAKLFWCQIVLVPNCPLFTAMPNFPLLYCGAKLSTFRLRCQIVLVPNCPLLHYGAKLSWCQIVHFYTTVPNCPPTWAVPNCPRCQIVRGAKLS